MSKQQMPPELKAAVIRFWQALAEADAIEDHERMMRGEPPIPCQPTEAEQAKRKRAHNKKER